MPRDIYETISSMLPEGVVFATPEQSREMFPKGAKDRWGETLLLEDSPIGATGTVYVNWEKLQQQKDAGAIEDVNRSAQKIVKGELNHMLKVHNPDFFEEVLNTAMADPKFVKWQTNRKETMKDDRSIEDFIRASGLDNTIGGTYFAGDPDLPSMKTWRRGYLDEAMGPELKEKIQQVWKMQGWEYNRGGPVNRPLYSDKKYII
tara:strand:- start:1317 stop:1928 length:612 start_codon:yes stop_codon:yes gene_type:complete